MASKEEIEMFVAEAESHIQKGEKDILKFEKNPDDIKLLEALYFGFQALKGLTAAIGLDKVSKFCLHFESLLNKAKVSKTSIKKANEFVNLIFESLNVLRSVVDRVKKGEIKDIDDDILQDLKDTLEDLDSEYDITFINPIPLEKVQSIIDDTQNIFYKIYVLIESTCKFKKVRLYFIFRALNKLGQICWSNPDPDILERGEFDLDFEIYFISLKKNEVITQTLDEILEIENKVINEMSPETFGDLVKNVSAKWKKEKVVAGVQEKKVEPKLEKKIPSKISTSPQKKNIPKIIFTNGIDGMKSSIITLPNNHFIKLINNEKVDVIFCCYKNSRRNSYFLYTIKEGFFLVTASEIFEPFEEYFEIKSRDFPNFSDFLEAIRYGIDGYEEYSSFKESEFFSPYIRSYEQYLKAKNR